MPRPLRHLLPALCIAAPASLLLSTGCGIVLFPIAAPHIVATNAQSIHFHVDITDEDGHPLNGVTVQILRMSFEPDLFVGEHDAFKGGAPRIVDRSFDYQTSGSFAVSVDYQKDGYLPRTVFYANHDRIQTGDYRSIVPVNVKTHPTSEVVLQRRTGR